MINGYEIRENTVTPNSVFLFLLKADEDGRKKIEERLSAFCKLTNLKVKGFDYVFELSGITDDSMLDKFKNQVEFLSSPIQNINQTFGNPLETGTITLNAATIMPQIEDTIAQNKKDYNVSDIFPKDEGVKSSMPSLDLAEGKEMSALKLAETGFPISQERPATELKDLSFNQNLVSDEMTEILVEGNSLKIEKTMPTLQIDIPEDKTTPSVQQNQMPQVEKEEVNEVEEANKTLISFTPEEMKDVAISIERPKEKKNIFGGLFSKVKNIFNSKKAKEENAVEKDPQTQEEIKKEVQKEVEKEIKKEVKEIQKEIEQEVKQEIKQEIKEEIKEQIREESNVSEQPKKKFSLLQKAKDLKNKVASSELMKQAQEKAKELKDKVENSDVVKQAQEKAKELKNEVKQELEKEEKKEETAVKEEVKNPFQDLGSGIIVKKGLLSEEPVDDIIQKEKEDLMTNPITAKLQVDDIFAAETVYNFYADQPEGKNENFEQNHQKEKTITTAPKPEEKQKEPVASVQKQEEKPQTKVEDVKQEKEEQEQQNPPLQPEIVDKKAVLIAPVPVTETIKNIFEKTKTEANVSEDQDEKKEESTQSDEKISQIELTKKEEETPKEIQKSEAQATVFEETKKSEVKNQVPLENKQSLPQIETREEQQKMSVDALDKKETKNMEVLPQADAEVKSQEKTKPEMQVIASEETKQPSTKVETSDKEKQMENVPQPEEEQKLVIAPPESDETKKVIAETKQMEPKKEESKLENLRDVFGPEQTNDKFSPLDTEVLKSVFKEREKAETITFFETNKDNLDENSTKSLRQKTEKGSTSSLQKDKATAETEQKGMPIIKPGTRKENTVQNIQKDKSVATKPKQEIKKETPVRSAQEQVLPKVNKQTQPQVKDMQVKEVNVVKKPDTPEQDLKKEKNAMQEQKKDDIGEKRKDFTSRQDSTNHKEKIDHTLHVGTPANGAKYKNYPIEMPLIPTYTFANMDISPMRFAHAMAMATLENLGTTNNPFLLQGVSGTGKTHFLHAMGYEISKKIPQSKILFTSGVRLSRGIQYSLERGQKAKLDEFFGGMEVLIIDDIHLTAVNEHNREYISKILNYFFKNKRQIIFSSKYPPESLQRFEELVNFKFALGTITELKIPNKTHFSRLTEKIVTAANLELSENQVQEFFCNRCVSLGDVARDVKRVKVLSRRIESSGINTASSENILKMMTGINGENEESEIVKKNFEDITTLTKNSNDKWGNFGFFFPASQIDKFRWVAFASQEAAKELGIKGGFNYALKSAYSTEHIISAAFKIANICDVKGLKGAVILGPSLTEVKEPIRDNFYDILTHMLEVMMIRCGTINFENIKKPSAYVKMLGDILK